MNDFIYPETVKYLLSNTKFDNIPTINFYNMEENQDLVNSLKKEQDLIKENYEYFTTKTKMLTKEQSDKIFGLKLFGYTKNPETDIKGYSNAYRKMYEICQDFNFIPKNKNITHLDLCSFPGSFIFGVNDFIKTKRKDTNYQFYFQSYIKTREDKGKYFEDRYRLAKKYKDRFLVKNNGDITTLKEINFLRKKLKNKCNIVTSDCGLESTYGSNYGREKQMTKTFLGQLVAGLGVIKKNGNFVMKYYHFYSIFNVSLIYLLGLAFKKVYLIKPASSRQFTGKEIYIMSIGYKDNIDDNKFDQLKNILVNFKDENLNKSIISKKDIKKDLFDKIVKQLIKYYDYKTARTYLRYKITSDFIGVHWSEDYDLYLKRKRILSKISSKIEEEWLKQYNKDINYIKVDKEDEL